VTARSEAPASFRSTAVRPGPLDLIRTGVAEVLSRRRLIGYLVRADIKKKGSDTLLGNIWWVVDPLLQMLIYVILVSVIFVQKKEDFALFVFCAILPWKWFQSAMTDGIVSVVGMEKVIKQVNFPKLVLPFASVMSGIVNFGFGLVPLAALMALFYADRASLWVLMIPLIAVVQLVFTLALATALSAINVFYRDVGNLARHFLRFWFYLSPGIYAVDLIGKVGEKFAPAGFLMSINPWATLFTAYRDAIYDERCPDFVALGILLAVSIVLLLGAILLFKRVEPSFAKVL
jgi:ABC-type polysaccharide/polyol phosphate export permease